jgi:hypothetical protein
MAGRRVPKLAVVLVVTGAVLTACGSGAKKAAAPTATRPPAGAATASTGATGATAPVPLTASFRGVTANTIKLGIVTIDYTCIKQFVNYNFGNQPAIDQVLINDLNAHGGILGRTIVPVYKSYCPIGNTTALAACTSFTEDDKVFAVMGLLYDNTGDADLCLSRDHQTIYIGHQLNQAWIDQAPPALMLSPDISAERRATVLLNLIKNNGTLTGKKVATFTDTDTATTVTKVIKPALDAMGLAQGSPAVVTIIGSDTSAAQSQLDSFIEKWKGEGVNALILAGNYVPAKQFVEKIRRGMPNVLILTDGAESAQGGAQDETSSGVKPNPYDGLLTATGLSDHETWETAQEQACVKTYQTGSGQQVIGPDQLQPGPDGKVALVWQAVRDFCDELGMFRQIATKAGPDLTNTTWAQAAANFGEIKLVTPFASIHAGKYDGDDAFRLAAFDETLGNKGDFRPLTPIQDASK